VFLSYDRDDAAKARRIASSLENAGHTVWWDKHISGGTQFAKEIEQALNGADIVVVLWSPSSAESPWVRDEAGSGRDRARLVPLSLDGTLPPLGFRQYQSIELGGWKGRGRVPRLSEILAAIERQLKDPGIPPPVGTGAVRRRQGPSLSMWALVAVGIGMFFVIVGLLIGHPWESKSSSTPTVSVRPADHSALSQDMARNLVLKLGEVQFARTQPIRLLAEGEEQKADLLLEAGVPAAGRANLLLKDGQNGSVLWSAEFERPRQQAADLAQQLAFTSARVLECGAEARSPGHRLRPEVLRSYLNVCAQLADLSVTDGRIPVRALREIVREEPRFKPAWVKLLMAENETVRQSMDELGPDIQAMADIRRDIAEARMLDPNIPVATVAEATLIEATDIPRYVSMLEQLVTRFPDDPYVQNFYAGALGKVGRLADAVGAAEKAVQLDPLSPFQRTQYISLLAYSGAFGPAQRELQKVERLWPGTASVRDAEFRFHYRYGDPRIARAIFEDETSGGGKAIRMYLDAREDPAKVQPLLVYVKERLSKMENPSGGIGTAIQAYAQFAGKEETLKLLLSWPKTSDLVFMADVLFRPHFRETRRDVRFMRVAQRLGLITYWQKSGHWPDFCFEADLTYDCKEEAARLGR
jgi:hypothetical protein